MRTDVEKDLNNYEEIFLATSAHKKNYSSFEPMRVDISFKYTNTIAQLKKLFFFSKTQPNLDQKHHTSTENQS